MENIKSSCIPNPNIYEINTRVWIRRFDTAEKKATLNDVPESYWDSLKEKGMDYVWLMGIWKTKDEAVKRYCFEEGLISEYERALKGWQDEDIIGSPYAIDRYEVNPALGDEESILKLRALLNRKGMKLFLDFVPNHFHAESSLIDIVPDIFLTANDESYKRDPHTFYKPFDDGRIFAHGRDPFFPAWLDTVQINYYAPAAREFMTNSLRRIAALCDGVRCDMSILVLNNVFQNTWGGALEKSGHKKPTTEFWADCIPAIKKEHPDFIFLAEAYWDLEWTLQQLGFDFTYDKKLTDRLAVNHIRGIYDHLAGEADYQKKCARFIENHDEKRSLTLFGKDRVKAAAVIISTVPGMHFYYDGQFEGKKIKLPLQLRREPVEQVNICIQTLYNKLLSITKEDIFKFGEWTMLEPEKSWYNNETYQNMLAWEWHYEDKRKLIVVNYSETLSTCRLKLNIGGFPEDIVFNDQLQGHTYQRSGEEISTQGLYVELKPFQSHIFDY
jgi:hypothetical protein